MLSSSSQANSGPPSRPRPPGAGRKSKTFGAPGSVATSKAQNLGAPPSALALDLPADALASSVPPPRASTMPAPYQDENSAPSSPAIQRSRQPSRSRLLNVFGADSSSRWDAAELVDPKSSPSRTSSQLTSTSDEQFSALINVALANMASKKKAAEKTSELTSNTSTLTPRAASAALVSLGASEMDAEQIGGLSRQELEQLLVAANRKIVERERDIAIAAQIGRTLVEKHDSIKAKHDGILRALSTANPQDLTPLVHHHQHRHLHEDDEIGINPPRYTPPTSDAHDYFGQAASSSPISSFANPSYGQPQPARRSTDSANSSISMSSNRRSLGGPAAAYMQQQLEDLEVRNDDLYVEVEGLRKKAEEDKRKDSEQLRGIHREMEALKAELSMAYSRNAELEDIARREDERKQLHGTEAWKKRVEGVTPAQQRSREWWDDATAQASPIRIVVQRPTTSRTNSHELSQDDGNAGDLSWDSVKSGGRQRLDEDVGGEGADLAPMPSRDDIAEAGAQDRERALVAQLLSKVRELEEANAAISARAKEFGDRAGRAFEQGERIKDEYEAVESASRMDLMDQQDEAGDLTHSRQAGTLRRAHTDGDYDTRGSAGHSFAGPDSPSSIRLTTGDSPTSGAPIVRRRAPGNRYAIEGRRTLRGVIRRERGRAALAEALALQGDDATLAASVAKLPNSVSISSISSFNSSLGSLRASSSETSMFNQSRSSNEAGVLKPRKSALMLGRPKIRITPSCEDMAAARKLEQQQKEGGWEDEDAFEAVETRGERLDEVLPLNHRDSQHRPGLPQSRSLRRIASESVIDNDSDTDAGNFTIRKRSTTRRRSRMPPSLEQMTPSSSIGSLAFPVHLEVGSSTPQTKMLSLGSELGSEFGDAEERASQLSTYGKNAARLEWSSGSDASPSNSPLKYRRPRRTQSSMTLGVNGAGTGSDDEDALSDIAELRFSGSSVSLADPSVSRIAGTTPSASFTDLTQTLAKSSPLDQRLQLDCSPATDGVWRADQPVVPHAALRDGEMTKYAAYDLLERAADNHPVTWADDEDFGRPITEGEARRLKLLEDGRSQRSLIGFRPSGLLGWLAPTPKRKKRNSALQHSVNGPIGTIESQEQVEERKQVSEMLRQKRLAALQRAAAAKSGRDYDLSPSSYKTRDAFAARTAHEEDEEEDELEARMMAFSPSSQRRVKRLSLHGLPPSGEELLIPGAVRKRRSNRRLNETVGDGYQQQQGVARGGHGLYSGNGGRPRLNRNRSSQSVSAASEVSSRGHAEEGDGDERQLVGGDENYELVEVPEHVRKQRSAAAKGTDYYPVDVYARYKPSMVQNRVKVASNEVVTLISTWALFATVTVFAFVVAFSRGPRRVLGTPSGAVAQPRRIA